MMESIISGTRNGVANSNVIQSDSTINEMGFMEPLHEISQGVVFADSKFSKGKLGRTIASKAKNSFVRDSKPNHQLEDIENDLSMKANFADLKD